MRYRKHELKQNVKLNTYQFSLFDRNQELIWDYPTKSYCLNNTKVTCYLVLVTSLVKPVRDISGNALDVTKKKKFITSVKWLPFQISHRQYNRVWGETQCVEKRWGRGRLKDGDKCHGWCVTKGYHQDWGGMEKSTQTQLESPWSLVYGRDSG